MVQGESDFDDDPHCSVNPGFFTVGDSSCIKSFVFARWQYRARRRFEISDRFQFTAQ